MGFWYFFPMLNKVGLHVPLKNRRVLYGLSLVQRKSEGFYGCPNRNTYILLLGFYIFTLMYKSIYVKSFSKIFWVCHHIHYFLKVWVFSPIKNCVIILYKSLGRRISNISKSDLIFTIKECEKLNISKFLKSDLIFTIQESERLNISNIFMKFEVHHKGVWKVREILNISKIKISDPELSR